MEQCAWCKVDTDSQQRYTTDDDFVMQELDHQCPHCHSFIDSGQKNISINSMKEIYQGAIRVAEYIVGEIDLMLLNYDIGLYAGIKEELDLEEDEPLEIEIDVEKIVKMLFLSHTRNSGGTSTRNLVKRLGINKEYEKFTLGEESDEYD